MQATILSLADERATLELVGGKGVSLAIMAAAGLPVPDGFHVTTAAYQAFVDANMLQDQIRKILKTVDAAIPASLEDASQQIGGLFAQGEMPAQIAADIRAAYAALDGGNTSVAVRSSATVEDLPEASFAGQQETFLNVRGEAALLSAVKKCWASLWTARAIAYRMKNKIDQQAIALAVVVQKLVQADAAGVLFTANPLSGRLDEMVINAAWGLGEAVVGGLVSPDTITVDKASGKINRMETAVKEVMTVRTAEGTTEQDVPASKRRTKVLNKKQVAALAEIASRVEALYKQPQDIEWCLAGKQFYIVQSRPVTTLGAMPMADWSLPDPKVNFFRSSLAEHLPNAASPLFATLGLKPLNEASKELSESMHIDLADANYQYTTLNGYVYMSYKLTPRFTWDMIRVTLVNYKSMLQQGTQHWQEAREEFAQTIDGWEQQDPVDLSANKLLEGVRKLMYAAGKYYTVIQSGALPSATTSEMVFSWLYKQMKREGDPDAWQLLLGLDSVALRAEKSLFDLAQWVGEHPQLREYILQTSSKPQAEMLQGETVTKQAALENWQAFKDRFDAHMQIFGSISFEYDFMNAAPLEMPELALDVLKVYLQGKGSDPYKRQQEADALRERTLAGMREQFHLIPWRWFKKVFNWVLRCAPVREDSLADMGMGHATVRRYLHELGSRFAAQGALCAAEDIYWLVEDEVVELAGLLEKDNALPDLSVKVEERKAQWEYQMKLKAPAVLPVNSTFASMIPWARENVSGNVLAGVAASAGKVTATARVLFGPEDFERMQAEDVLVAVTTTPAWTPLFTLASAVVTDIGGPLSHSSIVAREYGIPAVLATGIATRRIQDGQTITVDGDAGTVTLLD